ncbi:MAG: shikimate dehydrogenase [Kiritimatiellae bacterium]|nr:shikimate dehydrogenase [Kiritimatiellia bacterium]
MLTDAETGASPPDSRTRLFGLLGHPVAHSLSPAMHNAAFRALGMDAVYMAWDVAPGRVEAALRGLAALGCGGANVTVPHKEEAFRAMDRLDESARWAGSVNTVVFAPDGLVGHNTDAPGFLRAAREELDWAPAGSRMMVCGAGGAGRAIALFSARGGAGEVILCDTDLARASRVAEELRAAAPAAAVRVLPAAEAAAAAATCDLIVQATPLGMKESDPSPLPTEAFRPGQAVFDLVYVRPETPFMAAARRAGGRAANGLGMLLGQGALAFELWTGCAPPTHLMRRALERAVYG